MPKKPLVPQSIIDSPPKTDDVPVQSGAYELDAPRT